MTGSKGCDGFLLFVVKPCEEPKLIFSCAADGHVNDPRSSNDSQSASWLRLVVMTTSVKRFENAQSF